VCTRLQLIYKAIIGVGGGPKLVETPVQWHTLSLTKSSHSPIIY